MPMQDPSPLQAPHFGEHTDFVPYAYHLVTAFCFKGHNYISASPTACLLRGYGRAVGDADIESYCIVACLAALDVDLHNRRLRVRERAHVHACKDMCAHMSQRGVS